MSPVIAGLQPDLTPYLAGTDSIGAIETAKDFMVAGTAPDSLLGMCESMWRPDMVGFAFTPCRPCTFCPVQLFYTGRIMCAVSCWPGYEHYLFSSFICHLLSECACCLNLLNPCRSRKSSLRLLRNAYCLVWTGMLSLVGEALLTSCKRLFIACFLNLSLKPTRVASLRRLYVKMTIVCAEPRIKSSLAL